MALLVPASAFAQDTTAPKVSSTTPVSGATATLVQDLTATFSEAMSASTISSTTFTVVGPGTINVPGSVSYSGTTATFNPTVDLVTNHWYTATITTGAKDAAGNALASSYSWSFVTGPLAPVNLGTTKNFALLAGAAVSNIPTSAVTGDVGVSPAAGSFITGFGLTEITGTIYAPDATYPTANVAVVDPTRLTTAKGDLTTAYNDAAGRTPVPTGTYLNPGAGDLGGLSLVPGLYKFTGAAQISTNLTLTGGVNDVWIFQIASTLNVANGVQVILSGGAQAANIFWQVGTSASIGTTCIMQGTIMADQSVTMASGATLNGRALAFSASVTLDANTVTRPDIVAPTVSAPTVPNAGDLNVSINKQIAATFSESMLPSTLSNTIFTVSAGGTPVTGVVNYSGTTATFTPTSPLAGTTLYTAKITSGSNGAKDSASNTLVGDQSWTFTTETPDVTAPQVSTTNPTSAVTGVALNQILTVTFSEAMDQATLIGANFTLTGPGATTVAGTVTKTATTAIFTPTSSLAASTTFTATISTGVKDLAGNALASNYSWTFTTGATADVTAPLVSSTDPASGATGVASNKQIAATFSESMNPTTVTTSTVTVTGPGSTSVPGTVANVGAIFTFTPTSSLAASTTFTVTISTAAKDLAGNALASNYSWTFTTGAVADVTAPQVSSTDPLGGATGVATNKLIAATFSESMDPLTVTTATVTVTGPGTTPVVGTVTNVGTVFTFNPTSGTLATNTQFTATITTGAKDLAGNALASNYVWTFTTGATADVTAPQVSSTDPSPGATGVEVNKNIAVTFSESMNPSTMSTATFTVFNGSTPVAGAVTYAGQTVTFVPTSQLSSSTQFTAKISTGAKDLAGNALASDYSWTFTTGSIVDVTAPQVSSTDPTPGGTGVPVNKNIAVTFSESMDPSTMTTATFTLTVTSGSPILGTVSYVGRTATFHPVNGALDGNASYTATISTGAKDLAGNALASDYSWTFSTGSVADSATPTVSSTDPVAGATDVATNKKISVVFSEAMAPSTITTAFFTLFDGVTPVLGTVTYAGLTATFAPTSVLAANTQFVARISPGVADLAGNSLLAANETGWSFTTGAALDVAAPLVSSTDPAAGATDVETNKNIAVTLSESMDPLTMTTATFTVVGPSATSVLGAVTYAGRTATFNPTSDLDGNTLYMATLSTGVEDLAGNALASDYSWSFASGAAPDIIAPTVSSTDPAAGSTGVALNKKIAVTLSESMDPLTVTTATFKMTGPGTTPVLGTVSYADRTATFTPTSTLAANTLYTARLIAGSKNVPGVATTIIPGVKDLAGNTLASNYVWTFTTGVAADRTAPTVISTDPVDGAIHVAVNEKIIVTLSESIDPLTVNTATLVFTVFDGANPVPGTVTYAERTATFAPTSELLANTLYTVALTTGVEDLAGNNLASRYAWSFTTMAAQDLPAQLPVYLRSAAHFAILAGSMISNVPTSALIGDVGLSPAAGSFMTGFGLAEVTGTIYAVDATYPTANVAVVDPSGLAAAQGDLTIAYNDAVGRTPIPTDTYLNPGAGNLGGLTLLSGLYKFTGTAMISGADLTLTGGADDVWIFQIESALTVANSVQVVLAGEAQAANIFWQVGTSASLGVASVMQGTIMADQSITLATGATLNGRALARIAAVTLDKSIVAIPAIDLIAPTVSSSDVVAGAINVAVNKKIAVTLSKSMDPLTITSSTFTVTDTSGTPVLGTVSSEDMTAIFTPDSVLETNTLYTATITTGVKDLSGNPLASDFVWSFTTSGTIDLIPPTVDSSDVAAGATHVAINKKISATLSKSVDPSTITSTTFTVTGPGTTPVLGTVSYEGRTATFTPTGVLAANTLFTATITTGAKDLSGNPLANDYVWSFTTRKATDFDGDGLLDFSDFFLFADAFGKLATEDNVVFDLDGNGKVDFSDFFLFADSFSQVPAKMVVGRLVPEVEGGLALEVRSAAEGLILELHSENLQLRGYQVVVEYDPFAFRFEQAQDLQSVLRGEGEALLLNQEEYGHVLLLGSGTGQSPAVEGLLAELRFAPLQPEAMSTFRVRQALVRDGNGQLFQPEQLGQVEARWQPQVFSLQPNYPNPFNPSTTIRYQLPVSTSVHLEIYNVLGQKVRTLVAQEQQAGFYRVTWDSRNEAGVQMATGVYFYRLQAGGYTQVRQLLLLK